MQESDLERFFSYENQPNPPFLSDKEKLRPAKAKSGIVDSLLPKEYSTPHESPPINCKIFDGPALANMLSSEGKYKSFTQYAKEVFNPFLKIDTKSAQRLDLVFDCYFQDGLKVGTRSNRRTGVR